MQKRKTKIAQPKETNTDQEVNSITPSQDLLTLLCVHRSGFRAVIDVHNDGSFEIVNTQPLS